MLNIKINEEGVKVTDSAGQEIQVSSLSIAMGVNRRPQVELVIPVILANGYVNLDVDQKFHAQVLIRDPVSEEQREVEEVRFAGGGVWVVNPEDEAAEVIE